MFYQILSTFSGIFGNVSGKNRNTVISEFAIDYMQ